MIKKLHAALLGISSLLAAAPGSAQISLVQDYRNNYSPAIGTFQGINYREAGFSGMYVIPGTNGAEFWVCSDRGVNIDAGNANPSACHPTYDKLYAFPGYAPKIHRIRLRGDSVQILQTLSIKRPDGSGATGIINPTGFGSTAAEVPSTDTVQDCANFYLKTVPKDVWGIDAEGITVDVDGNFWVCEEGGPSVWKLDQNGKVIKRYSPYATLPGAEPQDFPIDTVFRYRKNNRGFEGIAITPNGKVYAAIQSPLLYPTKSVGENTRVHRILEIDPATGATRMFAYLNDGIIGTGSNQIRLKDWKLGDMAAINDSTLLVMEAASRGTTDIKRMYKINLNGATVVHGGLYGSATLEALVDSAGLAGQGVVPVQKTLVMDLLAHGWPAALDKAEGLAILNDSTVFICNDNDYGQVSPAEDGIATATTNVSHVVKYHLGGADKLAGYTPVMSTLSLGVTGPSTTSTPYLVPMAPGVQMTSILTAGDVVGSYKMCGTPDGMGAFDNGDGTFSVVFNHEFGNSAGATRAHGSTGSFVSRWILNKSDLRVLSGGDLIQDINLWNTATSSYVTYNAAFPSTAAACSRFCSADLPAPSAFYNHNTGKGTMARIFMNGEEAGPEGRAFGHIVTGPNAGRSYELPYLGKFSWENSVASPTMSDTTVVIGLDDASPGQIYVYVGTKSGIGSEIERAGLTGGRLYGVAVSGMVAESNGSTPTPATPFTLVDLGDVHNMAGSAINAMSNSLGVTTFLRPEDGSWDPAHPNDFYFATTNSFSGNSRLWKLHFTNAANPMLGGEATAVLDGSEGQHMMDNLTIDNYGHVIITEDVGNNAHIGKIWQYTIATDALELIGAHDSTRFLAGGANYLTQDEESSGVIDVETILGPGRFLIVDQAHYGISGEVVEGGQFLSFFNPTTYNAAPEADVMGNGVAIADGDNTPSSTDNTHFGSVNTGSSTTKTFMIHNSGQGTLNVTGVTFTGTNAAEFTEVAVATFPVAIAAGATDSVVVRFAPLAGGTRTATMHIWSNDVTEHDYDFALEGIGVEMPEINLQGNSSDIVDGDLTPGTANNTDFGSVNLGDTATHSFVIQNTGAGNLNVTAISFTGADAADFSLSVAPAYPVSIATAGTYTVTVKFIPADAGVRNATINISNNDADEGTYDFALRGTGVDNTGVAGASVETAVKVYPNPATNAATVAVSLAASSNVTISVLDVQGKEVVPAINKTMSAGQHFVDINTAAMQNGIYFIRVSDGSAVANVKLVVIR